MEFETVIGLEVHIQLSTKTKIFSGASAAFGADPNENIDPLTFGLPGTLPVLNRQVAVSAIKLGLALNCEIRRFNQFARKHYFYPDLPKGYQISQYEEPICEHGRLVIRLDDEIERVVGITRIHMEEDAGKNIHDARTKSSLIDLNRAGVPLLEVVSEPDIRSAAEAASYLKTLRQIARYLEISDGNMEEGSLRCDANISLRPTGQLKFGTRTEVKNINSFKFVERALNYEIARQLSILKGGGQVIQETRLFDSTSGTTHPMRSKEESADYRYFPDPDLPPLIVEESWVEKVRSKMPKLPEELRQMLIEDLGLTPYDASVLTAEKENVDFFLECYQVSKNAKAASNWITSELFGLLNKDERGIADSPISARNLGELLTRIDGGEISGKMAKEVFEEAFKTGQSPSDIIQAKGLKQISDESELLPIIEQILETSPNQLAEYFSGKEKLRDYFVGQVMKATKGSADPKKLNLLLDKELGRRKDG
ncbi:MAG: Asp-tRNA(Asn)/Glu-tRNA(Gln) amidotransferase subunit GatB [Bdellovibrionales bacterium]|nr:Asp-tRNA(Asn)/Glu-tRNA(Gln) amidotransferase subunit GatB [Bdellovibrionales bacterium]